MRTLVAPTILFFLVVVVWQTAVYLLEINPIILPSPIEIAAAMYEHPVRLLRETGVTMSEAILGFCLGSAVAFIMAVIFVHSDTIRDAVYPFAVALKSTPLVAIAPLLVLWFGNGMLSKVVMSAVIAFFPVLVNSVNGLLNVDRDTIDLMRSLSASRLQILIRVRIPSSLGFIFASLKIASSLSVVGAIIGEYTGSTRGIGYLINTSSYYLETPLMFAGIIMIAVGGIAFFAAISFLEQRLLFWQNPM